MSDRLIRKQRSTDEVRALFRELVAMGIGELSGEGRQLEWRYCPPVDGSVDNQELTRSAPPGSHERPLAEAGSTLSTGQDNNGHRAEQDHDSAIEQESTRCQLEETTTPGVDTRMSTSPSLEDASWLAAAVSVGVCVDEQLTAFDSAVAVDASASQPVVAAPVDRVDARIGPGDRVYYVGCHPCLNKLCGAKPLRVEQVDGEQVSCSYSSWYVCQTIAIADLRKVPPQSVLG